MKNNRNIIIVLLLVSSFAAVTIPAFADTNSRSNQAPRSNMARIGSQRPNPGILGTVSSINGNVLTINSKLANIFGKKRATTTPQITPITKIYTVDTSNAIILKNNAISSVSNIAIGDTVVVQGTITGTSITATTVRDRIMMGGRGNINKPQTNAKTPQFQGNGQPIIAGKIATINSSTVTVTNSSNITYSVDATNAKISQGPNTVLISNLNIGDNVVVQGTVNGTSIIASSIIDQVRPVLATTTAEQKSPQRQGFLGRIGGFFGHLFGF